MRFFSAALAASTVGVLLVLAAPATTATLHSHATSGEVGEAGPSTSKPDGTNGKIVVNVDTATGQEQAYTIDPDGTDMQLLASEVEAGQWSPDGERGGRRSFAKTGAIGSA